MVMTLLNRRGMDIKMKYIKRLIDKTIDQRIKAFNAINIQGPKGCGKQEHARKM